jgi:hypothetical protein
VPRAQPEILIHHVALGMLHRSRSTVELPHWLHEGIGQWAIANMPVGGKDYRRRQEWAVNALHESPNLLDFFKMEQFQAPWQPGVAAAMIDILLKTDPSAFRQYVREIKEGQPWRAALQETYNLTPDDLSPLYGQQIGVPNLRP